MEYHKIQTVFKRNPETNHKTLLWGDFSLPEFAYLAENRWVFTEKVDGTNIRIYFEGGKMRIGGRTDNAQIPAFLLDAINGLLNAEKLSSVFGESDAILYGEGYGNRIQKVGGNYRPDNSFVLFDVRVGRFWLQRNDVDSIASNLGIESVPVVGEGTLWDMLREAQEKPKSTWGDFESEGFVARPDTELLTRSGSRIITKIKCRDFQ